MTLWPSVCNHEILFCSDLKKSLWYIVNGAVMTVVFLCCRVVFFPVVYYLFSLEHGKFDFVLLFFLNSSILNKLKHVNLF